VPEWIWFIFIFAFGCCIGSFLNVVIYRLPRDKSLIKPGSSCPECGKHIRFYDNIPLVSWLVLGRKCRYCKAPISPRYFVVELLTSVIFVGLFYMYFHTDLLSSVKIDGIWLIYLLHIILLAAFIAASAIDLEYWVIPMSICWFVTAVGIIGSAAGMYIIQPVLVREYMLLPTASPSTASLAVGAIIGLAISWTLMAMGLLKRSYESTSPEDAKANEEKTGSGPKNESSEAKHINHRVEMFKEILFLLPIIICSTIVFWLTREVEFLHSFWESLLKCPFIAGFLGSVWGYFIGCGVVWATRILGTLAFGKEAMGLGDVHLMGAAGAVIGPVFVVVAFFVAPFFGLVWAGFQLLFRKIRQIPYGPFLSLGVFTVMILHDWILNRFCFYFFR